MIFMRRIRKFLLRWWPSALCVAFILYVTLSSKPFDNVYEPLLFEGCDKIIHFLMFGGLTSVMMFDYRRVAGPGRLTPMVVFLIGMLVIAYGVLDEVMQAYLTTTRTGDTLDFGADMLGIAVAALTMPPVVNQIAARFEKK